MVHELHDSRKYVNFVIVEPYFMNIFYLEKFFKKSFFTLIFFQWSVIKIEDRTLMFWDYRPILLKFD